MSILKALNYILENKFEFLSQCSVQLKLFIFAFTLSLIISLPLAYLCYKNYNIKKFVMAIVNSIKVIPPIAIIAFLIPIMNTGYLPSLTALVILSIPHILSSTYAGLTSICPDILESSCAIGMNKLQIFYKIELPLSLPVILTGCRTASIEIIACSTIAAFIGSKGLGEYIISGVGMMEPYLILVGILPICTMILICELIFDVISINHFKHKV